jgi:hypothetical protein
VHACILSSVSVPGYHACRCIPICASHAGCTDAWDARGAGCWDVPLVQGSDPQSGQTYTRVWDPGQSPQWSHACMVAHSLEISFLILQWRALQSDHQAVKTIESANLLAYISLETVEHGLCEILRGYRSRKWYFIRTQIVCTNTFLCRM